MCKLQIDHPLEKNEDDAHLPLAEGGLNPQSFSKYSPSQYNGTAVLSASPSLWRVGAVGDSNARGAKMEKYKVWEIVLRPSNMRIVGARWV